MASLRNYLNLFVFLFTFSSGRVLALEFSFDSGVNGWAFNGSGEGRWVQEEGRAKDGSLYLSTQWGDQRSVHFKLKDLKPGIYEFKAWLKMFEVQLPFEGDAFWHFYDNGSGVQTVFRDLNGSSEWSQIVHRVRVTKSGKIDLWFRLKVPGQVWLDDVSFVPAKKEPTEQIFSRIRLTKVSLDKYLTQEAPKKASRSRGIELFGFEKSQEELETGHPFIHFSSKKKTTGIRSAVLSQGNYYNFNLKDIKSNDWSAFENIELDVYSPLERAVPFSLVLADERSTGYWSKLNHKTKLSKGWNKLSFNLRQWVGEIDSVKIKRNLDLKKLSQFFVIIDPDNKNPTTKEFFIDQIKLSSDESPVVPSEIYAFDFTNHKKNSMPGFTPITSQTLYRKERGFGFVEHKIWEMLDSVYADRLNRYSIGLTSGNFRVKLPNGRYQVHLGINHLGYRDVPFWTKRTVYFQGKPAFKEAHSFGKDYLRGYLRFEETEPETLDHPYDLYLKEVFSPLVQEVFVTEGFLDIGFEGDPSAIGLNSLIIFKKENRDAGKMFLAKLDKYLKKDYSRLVRRIEPRRKGSRLKRKKEVSLINLSAHLEPTDYFDAVKTEIIFLGFKSMRLRQLVQLHAPTKRTNFKVELTNLKEAKGISLPSKGIKISRLVNSFISENLNHETYLLSGKYFKEVKNTVISVPHGESRFILVEIPIEMSSKPGVYNGFLKVSYAKENELIPLEIKLKANQLAKVKLPVGFLGLDPLPKSYFKGKGYEKLQWFYREKVLNLLGSRGFTSFSGLPEVPLVKDGEDWQLNWRPLEQLISKSKKMGVTGPFFSYGGEFPEKYFSLLKGNNQKENLKNHEKMSPIFKKGFQKLKNDIIYTYSDEAGAYPDKIKSDFQHSIFLKKSYPDLKIGGFTEYGVSELSELNKVFDFAFYSNFKSDMRNLKQKWGTYNGTPRAMDDPRFGFGPVLYASQKQGLSHYLDWHMAAYNNYPYFDLDGRESEVAMVYPRMDGSLVTSLKFELSAEGLQDYRLLMLLEKRANRTSGSNDIFKVSVKKWLSKVLKAYGPFSRKDPFSSYRKGSYDEFHHKLLKHLENLLQLN